MKALLDTDLLLDVALNRTEFYTASATVLRWAESNPGRAAVAWHSLSNMSYLLRPDARPFIRALLEFVEIPVVGTEAAIQAIGYPMNDFEDALQAAAALAFGARFIVTRNVSDYRRSPVPAISPSEYIKELSHK
jgi:hypothetical protein